MNDDSEGLVDQAALDEARRALADAGWEPPADLPARVAVATGRVRALLKDAAGDPDGLPDAVAARVRAALVAVPTGSRTVVPLPAEPLHPRSRRLLVAAAALVLLGGVAAVVAAFPASPRESSTTAATGSTDAPEAADGSLRSADPLVVRSGRDYDAAAVAALLGAGHAAGTALVLPGAAGPAGDTAPTDRLSRSQVRGATPAVPTGSAPAALARLEDPAALRSCLAGLDLLPGQAADLVDLAAYQGEAAAVVVVGAGTTRAAYVVGPDCSATNSDLRYYRAAPG